MTTAIDLFAGLGGNTAGAKDAGISVIWAANHNPLVVDLHKQNHPDVFHACQDLQQVNWEMVPGHNIMLASPCCQGHTHARGKEGPHHHTSRSTAWAALSCVEFHKPELFMIENVVEMECWSLFSHWISCFKALGYSLSKNIFDSADYGIPQHRKRLFIVGTKSNHPIKVNMRKDSHIPFSSIVDMNSAKWSSVNKPGRAKATLERVKNGRLQYGDYFVMPYYSNGSGKTGRCINRPLGTVTTKDRWAIVNGNNMRMLSVKEYRDAMSFSAKTILPERKDYAVHALGNATCPKLIKQVLTSVLKAA